MSGMLGSACALEHSFAPCSTPSLSLARLRTPAWSARAPPHTHAAFNSRNSVDFRSRAVRTTREELYPTGSPQSLQGGLTASTFAPENLMNVTKDAAQGIIAGLNAGLSRMEVEFPLTTEINGGCFYTWAKREAWVRGSPATWPHEGTCRPLTGVPSTSTCWQDSRTVRINSWMPTSNSQLRPAGW